MIKFCPLASGSKGNAIYVAAKGTKVLIDCGLSMRAATQKLAEIGVDIADIQAIVVSHEHTDHIRGIERTATQLGIPVLANSDTAKAASATFRTQPQFKIFSTGENFRFGAITFHPFSIQHDTLDPVAFTLRIDDYKIGVCTDLGFVTSLVRAHLTNCDLLYIESNHEPSMVHACPRPMVYKTRVLGRQGHLSNEACAELLKELAHPGLKKVYLAHLSSECNAPEVALNHAKGALAAHDIPVAIAYQERVSDTFELQLTPETA